jgi:sugar phosphate isomerase/epimerase
MKSKLALLYLLILTPLLAYAQTNQKYDNTALGKLGWKIAAQAWTFKLFTLDETLDKLNELGIKYIELYPTQKIGGDIEGTTAFTSDQITVEKIKALLDKKGIKALNYGVVKPKTDEEWVKTFEFAKALGIETIVTEPLAKHMDLIESLCDQHNINVAIHNHPKPTPYWNPDLIKPLFTARSSRIGACGDIGHWVRSGLNPLDCLYQLEGRFISFHFKDINQFGVRQGHDVPWGTGNCNVAGVMNTLKVMNFKGVFSIEYEYNWDNSLPEVKESIDYFYRVAYWMTKEYAGAGWSSTKFNVDRYLSGVEGPDG